MSAHFDPWDDASVLAQRIHPAGSRLNIIIAAEAWCARCRDLWPEFEAIVDRAPADETWLWLDLEDHAEFVGAYLPDSLPVLLVYRGSAMIAERMLDNPDAGLQAQLAMLASAGPATAPVRDSGIRARLLSPNWAVE